MYLHACLTVGSFDRAISYTQISDESEFEQRQFAAGTFHWTSGKALLKIHQTPGGTGWCFCSDCGSTLAGTDKGEVTSITLGTVEGDPGTVPEAHIFTGSKAAWHEIYDNLPQFEEWPGNT